jgi:hypothetical protein
VRALVCENNPLPEKCKAFVAEYVVTCSSEEHHSQLRRSQDKSLQESLRGELHIC